AQHQVAMEHHVHVQGAVGQARAAAHAAVAVFQRVQPGFQLRQREAGMQQGGVVEEGRAVEADRRGAVGRGDPQRAEAGAQFLQRRAQVALRLQVAAEAEQYGGGARGRRLAVHAVRACYCCADWSPGSLRAGTRRGGNGGSADGSSVACACGSQGKRGRVRTAFSSLRDQVSWISAYSGVSASSRICWLTRRSPARTSARSTGSPTERLERMVESSDSRAQRAASSSAVPGRTMRSRIGLPYLDSPICR